MRGPRIVGLASPALAFLRNSLARGPRPVNVGAPRPIEAKRRKSLILKDFPRIAAAGFSAEDKDLTGLSPTSLSASRAAN
jgi:hypothetical protein